MILACGILPLAMGEDGGSGTSENGPKSTSKKGKEIHGLAYSNQNPPVNIDEPDEEQLPWDDERPGNETRRYDGTWAYDLTQGTKPDDKRRWATTDYIHWTLQGATLAAEGQIQDTDPSETGEVSSEAWGAQIVAAQVTQAAGTQGTISAENMIGFSHRYLIMGSRILEASVLLQGSTVDITGASHSYSIADSKAQALAEVTTQSRAVSVRHTTGAGVSIAAGPTGGSAGVTAASETEIAASGRIDVSTGQRFAGAGNGAGSIDLPPIKHSVSGRTPLNHTYEVYSEGSVALTAKGGGADVPGGTTVVKLDEFKIRNQLRVYVKAESTTTGSGGEGGGATPGSGGGGTGGGGPDGGGSGGDGTGEDGTGEDGSVGDPEDGTSDGSEGEASEIDEPGRESLSPIGPTRSPSGSSRTEAREILTDLTGLEGAVLRLVASAPIGLASEGGSVPGELQVLLDRPAPYDLVFSVVANPPESLVYLCGETITIRAGQLAAGGPLDSAVAGEVSVSVHLLNELGELSGRVLAVPVETRSLSEIPLPAIYATSEGAPWRVGIGTTILGLRAQLAPSLVIGRLGFDEFTTQATTFTLTMDDANGVLPALPGQVTIAPSESEVRIPLLLNDVEGEATIRIESDGRELLVRVVSRTQAVSGLPVIRVPLGATAFVPVALAWPERTGRVFHATVVDAVQSDSGQLDSGQSDSGQSDPGATTGGAGSGGVGEADPIRLEEGETELFMPAGLKYWCAGVRGLALGQARVRFETEGLEPFEALVEVTRARVSVSSSQLTLTSLPTGTSGTIEIHAPQGVTFESVRIPAVAMDYMSIEGAGSGRLVITLVASPDVPESLAIGLELSGAVDASTTFDVREQLVEDMPLPCTNNYHLPLASDNEGG